MQKSIKIVSIFSIQKSTFNFCLLFMYLLHFNSSFHPSNKITIFVLDHLDDLICFPAMGNGFELNQLKFETL